VLALAVLPIWKPIDPMYGPEDVVRYAPRGVTETLLAEADPGDRLYASQKWGSWFELAVPELPIMVDTRIELFDGAVWTDYLRVINGLADWADILDEWEVQLVAVEADNEQLLPFINEHPGWELLFEDDEGVVYRRAQGAS